MDQNECLFHCQNDEKCQSCTFNDYNSENPMICVLNYGPTERIFEIPFKNSGISTAAKNCNIN